VNRARLAGCVVGAGLAVAGALAFTLARGSDEGPSAAAPTEPTVAVVDPPVALERPVVSDAELQDRVGVRLQTVATTAGGGLIDLRFQVIDPSKAAAVHDDATPPTMVDEATGLIVNQLLMGHSHTGAFAAGQAYYLVFENPGNLVHQGSKVTVLLGDAQLEHVVVGG
jgi:hypothetical protein